MLRDKNDQIHTRERKRGSRQVAAEDLEQKKIFEWIAYNKAREPKLRLAYHVPNESKRSTVTGARLKQMGMLKGVSDICLPFNNNKYSNLYIELKAGNNKATQEQISFIEGINEAGGKGVVVYDGDNAIEIIKAYLENRIDSLEIVNNTYPAKYARKTKKKYIGGCGNDCRECDCYECIGRKR